MRRKPNNIYSHRAFKSYGDGRNKQGFRRNAVAKDRNRIPWDVCIVCNQNSFYSSVHTCTEKQMHKPFASAYLRNGDVHDSKREENEGSEEEEDSTLELESDSYIIFIRASLELLMSPQDTKRVVDGAQIDMGSNITSSVGLLLLPAVKVANMRNVEPQMGNSRKRLNGIGISVRSLEITMFHFHFGGFQYSVMLNIFPGPTPLIISQKDLDSMERNY